MPEMLKLSKSLVACLLATGCGTVTGSPPDTTARVRVAHVSPGAPAVDFCLARHGTTQFTGPILAGAGRAAGLSYATVTRYFDVDAARYDVRLVAPGAASCAQPLAGLDDFTRLPELTAGGSATIAAEGTLGGQGDAAFTLRAYADDAEAPPGQASLRFVHASPGTPPVDAGTGGGSLFAPVFSAVAFGAAATVTTAPLTDALVSARAHGTAADVLAFDHTSLPAGTIATAFAIGQLGGAAPLRVLLCLDNAEPNGVHAACSVVGDAPREAHLRIAHLSPDAPAVDVCLAPAGSHAPTPTTATTSPPPPSTSRPCRSSRCRPRSPSASSPPAIPARWPAGSCQARRAPRRCRPGPPRSPRWPRPRRSHRHPRSPRPRRSRRLRRSRRPCTPRTSVRCLPRRQWCR